MGFLICYFSVLFDVFMLLCCRSSRYLFSLSSCPVCLDDNIWTQQMAISMFQCLLFFSISSTWDGSRSPSLIHMLAILDVNAKS